MNHIQTNFSSFFNKITIGAMLAFLFIVVGQHLRRVSNFWRKYNKCNNHIGNFRHTHFVSGINFTISFYRQTIFIFLISISIVVRLSMLLFVDAPIIGDMKVMYESAKEIAIGNNIGTVTHLPFIIYESVIIRIFGDTLFALQLFNVLFCAGTAFLFIVLRQWFWGRMRSYCFHILCSVYSKYIHECRINS